MYSIGMLANLTVHAFKKSNGYDIFKIAIWIHSLGQDFNIITN